MLTMNMIQSTHNTCHTTISMLYLSRDNIRSHNDGRRTSATSQGAWIEPVQRQEVKAYLSLCYQVWRKANLHCAAYEVATAYQRGGSKEDQLTGILPVAPRQPSIEDQTLDGCPML